MTQEANQLRPAFLLSMPRSGSTLLQRLLGAHSQVATIAEPWLLLAPLYILRQEGVYAEYGHKTAVKAVASLCEQLPGGRGDYLSSVAAMAKSVYRRISPPGTRVFLDKTPRYGLVVDELLSAFPDASFIVLYRNPLSILASISATFDHGKWQPYHHKQDLFLLPERLLSAQSREPQAFTTVRYEDLLQKPETSLRELVGALGLEWEDSILETFTEVSVAGAVGDRAGVNDYTSLSWEPLSKWPDRLATPIRKAWARRYLLWLGDERLRMMGYELDRLLEELDRAATSYREIPADMFNATKGVLWSLLEVESIRHKLRTMPRWREVFTHT